MGVAVFPIIPFWVSSEMKKVEETAKLCNLMNYTLISLRGRGRMGKKM